MFVYLIRNKVNGKCYVGQTTQDVNVRLRNHRNKANMTKPSRLPIHQAIKKHGWAAFDKFVLEVCDSIEAMDVAEQYWIAKYDCLAPNGYNLESGGGKAVREIHPETRQRMSEAHAGHTRHTDESRKAIGDARRGHIKSDEDRRRRSERMKERWASGSQPPRRQNYSPSAESKAKYAATVAGENSHCAKLTWEKVREIRRLASEGMTNLAIAELFNINNGTVGRVVRQVSWKPEFDPLNASVSAE